MRAKTKAKSRPNWVLRLVLVAVAVFLFLKMVQLHVQLDQKEQMLHELAAAEAKQEVINEALSEQVAHAEDFLEQQANENGYFYAGQQIYQSSAG